MRRTGVHKPEQETSKKGEMLLTNDPFTLQGFMALHLRIQAMTVMFSISDDKILFQISKLMLLMYTNHFSLIDYFI